MKSLIVATLAIAGFCVATNDASAQYIVRPHGNHYHVTPVYSPPVYAYPTYSPGITIGGFYSNGGFGIGGGYGYGPVYSAPRVIYNPGYHPYGSGYGYGPQHHHHYHR